MANETETSQNNNNNNNQQQQQQQLNGVEGMGQQVKHVKGYRKKGLVSEKVLLERLSDMSIEDDLLNPGITLSSVEDDDDGDNEGGLESPMEEGSPEAPVTSTSNNKKGTLQKSLSLAVPSTLNLQEEPKRPPL
ncbi:hypothetical protein Pcinc_044461 [Petrolisthes cinctipes]|uniref:Uncharacterized protein n=1 Tax=Petrolisthes cinctipes TaxID=88211 RepID=A0AAE1EFD3_PETCI|nr:hypothetical protein Pcinc_044461 [Petrolisthes cinctipes]